MLAGGLGPAMAAWALKAGLMLVGLTIHDLPKLGAEPKFRATVAGFQKRWAFVDRRTLARLQKWSHAYSTAIAKEGERGWFLGKR